MSEEIIISNTPESNELLSVEENNLLVKELSNVREEIKDCPYLEEALRVLPAKGYRSAIGSYWNSVVDDLRQKILHRSIDLFNKEVNPKRKIEKYEDFQDHVTEYDLVEGAYKIGVLSWEGRKLMHQARETRNMFYGHPKTSSPNLIKVLNLISDCNQHVLSEEFPPSIIDISTYLSQMDGNDFDRNELAVEQAFSDLPSIYKTELANRFFTTYVTDTISSDLRANIEFCAPILWGAITKDDKKQIGKRFDKTILEGVRGKVEKGLDFINHVSGLMYVNVASRKVIIKPLVQNLDDALDQWEDEEKAVSELFPLSRFIPEDYLFQYICSTTLTFVGYKGSSRHFSRTDFYCDSAASTIKKMFGQFDSKSADIFVDVVRSEEKLIRRIRGAGQLRRLRLLANILIEKEVGSSDSIDFMNLICDDQRESELYESVSSAKKRQQSNL